MFWFSGKRAYSYRYTPHIKKHTWLCLPCAARQSSISHESSLTQFVDIEHTFSGASINKRNFTTYKVERKKRQWNLLGWIGRHSSQPNTNLRCSRVRSSGVNRWRQAPTNGQTRRTTCCSEHSTDLHSRCTACWYSVLFHKK